jgi:hypothetical protein
MLRFAAISRASRGGFWFWWRRGGCVWDRQDIVDRVYDRPGGFFRSGFGSPDLTSAHVVDSVVDIYRSKR